MSTLYLRFAAHGPDTPRRSPRLESLLARAGAAVAVADWRLEALRTIAPDAAAVPSPAAMQLRTTAVRPGAALDDGHWTWACMASPVHFEAGMSSVSLQAGGLLRLSAAEAADLADDFNREFIGAGTHLQAVDQGWIVCLWNRVLEVTTQDPAEAVGGNLFEHQPAGADAASLRRLASEVEMWLFDHPLNRARAAAGQPAITGLWFWGGGRVKEAMPALRGWAGGDDPLFAALGRTVRGQAGSGVGVCLVPPGSDGWRDAEQRWLEPAVEALRSGALTRIDLSAGPRRYAVTSGFGWRFWRRPRPWWESFDATP